MKTRIIVEIEDIDGYMNVVIVQGEKVFTSHTVDKALLPKDPQTFVDKLLQHTDKVIPVIVKALIEGSS